METLFIEPQLLAGIDGRATDMATIRDCASPVQVEVLHKAQFLAVPLQMPEGLLLAVDRHMLVSREQHADPMTQRNQLPVISFLLHCAMQSSDLCPIKQRPRAHVSQTLKIQQLRIRQHSWRRCCIKRVLVPRHSACYCSG